MAIARTFTTQQQQQPDAYLSTVSGLPTLKGMTTPVDTMNNPQTQTQQQATTNNTPASVSTQAQATVAQPAQPQPYTPGATAAAPTTATEILPAQWTGQDPHIGTPVQNLSANSTEDQVRTAVNQYITQGGAPNTDNGQYWVNAWNEWGKNDPNYFVTRLQAGIAQQSGYNGAFGAASSSSGAAGSTPSNANGDTSALLNLANDPFSQTIQGALTGLIGTQGATTNQDSTMALLKAIISGGGTSPSENQTEASLRSTADSANGLTPEQQQTYDQLQHIVSAGGATPQETSLLSTLQGIIDRGGALPQSILDAQLESAREAENTAYQSQYKTAEADLANRGLVSTPGAPQGQEASAIDRISEAIAPQYAGAVRDINTNAQTLAEQRLQNAIGTSAGITGTQANALQQALSSMEGIGATGSNAKAQALSTLTGLGESQQNTVTSALSSLTGLSTSEASQYLSTLGQGTQRQSALASIALQSLSQNMQWNEFLAQYGLNADQLMYTIQQGNASSIMPMLQLFVQLFGQGSAGSV